STGANGYSVDNLAPPQPLPSIDDSNTPWVISWPAPGISDFNQACVYRGDASGFTPGAALACTGSTSYQEFDTGTQHFYRVQFSDTHGNLGPMSDEIASSSVSGVPVAGGWTTSIARVS